MYAYKKMPVIFPMKNSKRDIRNHIPFHKTIKHDFVFPHIFIGSANIFKLLLNKASTTRTKYYSH